METAHCKDSPAHAYAIATTVDGDGNLELGLAKLRLELDQKHCAQGGKHDATATNKGVPTLEKAAEPQAKARQTDDRPSTRPRHCTSSYSNSCQPSHSLQLQIHELEIASMQVLEAERDALKEQLATADAKAKTLTSDLARAVKIHTALQWALQQSQQANKMQEEELCVARRTRHAVDYRCAVLERQNFLVVEALSQICAPPAVPYLPVYDCERWSFPQAFEPTMGAVSDMWAAHGVSGS